MQWLSSRRASPVLAIYMRWLRWGFFSMGSAVSLRYFELSSRPLWMLAAFAFLTWFLVETVYYWMVVSMVSKSELELFPKFKPNETLGEWPNQKRFIVLKDWLRHKGFKKVQAMIADLGSYQRIRSSVYADESQTIWLQIMFLPHSRGNVAPGYSIISRTQQGDYLITDNFFLPFGGFYPENWHVVRKPWTRDIMKLLQFHCKRIEDCGQPLVSIDDDPVAELNRQQQQLDRLNTELGFLMPMHLRGDYGKITREGRYRVWKELWLLSYFGKPLSYS